MGIKAPRVCVVCGVSFTGHGPARYCGEDCRRKRFAAVESRTAARAKAANGCNVRQCTYCHQDYVPYKATAVFCSRRCREANRRAITADQKKPVKTYSEAGARKAWKKIMLCVDPITHRYTSPKEAKHAKHAH